MHKANRRTIDTSDMPEITTAQFKKGRRATPEQREAYRKAIEAKLGVSRPPRLGRPPKHPSEKCVPISWRTPPQVKEWLKAQAKHVGIRQYQTFLSILLQSMTRYEAVKEKNGITLRLPNSEHAAMVIAAGMTVGQKGSH